MKQFFLSLSLLLLSTYFYAQSISGTVKDINGNVLPGAVMLIKGTNIVSISSETGTYKFSYLKPGNYRIEASLISFETIEKFIKVTDSDLTEDIVLSFLDFIEDEIVITALRADKKTPIAYTEIEKESIEERNQGQDIPYILEMTPSVVVSSDAGTGIGYTSMRIRGTDMTRINVTLDGIPLNDPESHGVWWVNMPDFASSVENIQIQRGVGSSTNGAASFGANLNFVTNTVKKNAYADIGLSYGSFNTQKSTFIAGTGLLKNHFAFDARFSRIHSDGFVDRARTDLKSYFLSGTYIDKKNILKLNIFSGEEETFQAWSGIPKDSLSTNRTYNPYSYENEIDSYSQTHYQLFYTRKYNKYFSSNIALHYTKGAGYYEQYKEDETLTDYGLDDVIIGTETISNTDLIRRKWLNNDFIGIIYSYQYSKNNLKIVYGGSYNKYFGDHFGRIIWAEYASNGAIDHEWYFNSGTKTDLNEYVKMNYYVFSKSNIWLDLQYRKIDYGITGIHDDLRNISQEHSFQFFNPKVGFSYDINQNQNSYISFAVAKREPSRSNFRDASPDEEFEPETLYDFEAGYKFAVEKAVFNFNLYYMHYQNQLILTGELNDVGAYIMTNVPESYRAGAELSGGFKLFDFMNWNMNLSLSRNRIKNLTVYVDNWDTWGQESETYTETDISFSPEIVAGSELSFQIFKGFKASFVSKYVGKQFIDNTSNDERSLNPYFVNNLRINYAVWFKKIKEINFNVSVNNIFNERYETNAWVYRYLSGGEQYVMDGYFPQAGLNFLAGINLRF